MLKILPKELLNNFNVWFEQDNHSDKEDCYSYEITYNYLSSLLKTPKNPVNKKNKSL